MPSEGWPRHLEGKSDQPATPASERAWVEQDLHEKEAYVAELEDELKSEREEWEEEINELRGRVWWTTILAWSLVGVALALGVALGAFFFSGFQLPV
jgi:hypothetical protein